LDGYIQDNSKGTELLLSNGAIWNNSGVSNVTKLRLKDGIVRQCDGAGPVTVGDFSGKGTIEFNSDGHLYIDSGSGKLNLTAENLTVDKFNDVAGKLGVKDKAKGIKATVVLAEGDVTGEVTGEVIYSETAEHEYYHGTVTEVTEKVNTKNQAISDTAIGMKLHWRAHVDDMNKRMGELRDANGEHGVWTRMVRGESEYKNTKAQYNQYQLGYDEKLSVDKRWTVGAAVTFAEGDANYGQGSTEDKSTAFAIYGSKLNNDGTFVDLIARYTHLESDLDDANSGKGDYATNGMSVSAEFGKRIQQGNGLWIEPQVELTYGTIDSAEFKFDNGKAVQVGDMDSLIGRIGFRIGKDIEKGNVYARASYLYDFDGETENIFSKGSLSRTIKEDLGGGWWEVGVGANINLSKATYIYADVEKAFGGAVDTNWQWNLGVRYSF
jgi:outer membrane autotransporter protein